MTQRIVCPGCGREISADSADCPHCGRPQPGSPAARSDRRRRRLIAGVILGAVLLGAVAVRQWLVSALPACNAPAAQADAQRALAASLPGRPRGLSIIRLTDIDTVAASRARVACRAEVLWSNGLLTALEYSFTTDTDHPGRYLTRIDAMP